MMPDDFFRKNIEMWEQFTSNYMETMFKTVEKAMEQSQVFRSQVDKTVNQAMAGQMETTLAMLKAMQQQLDVLAEKVDQLIEKEA